MLPLFRDPHPTCARCRGKKCTSDVTCDIFKDWSVVQWEVFLKKCSYRGRRKSRPSGSSLPTVPRPLLPSAFASSEAGRHSPPPPSSLPSEGQGRSGESKVISHIGSRNVSPPPSCRSVGEKRGGGGGGVRGSWLLGVNVTRLLLPPPRDWGSGALSFSGVTCARSLCPSLGRILCLGGA